MYLDLYTYVYTYIHVYSIDVWYKCTELRHEHNDARNQLNSMVSYQQTHTTSTMYTYTHTCSI